MAIKIADLFAGLKVKVDNSSIKAADKAIEDLKYALTGLGVYATARWFKGLIDDTVALGGKLADTSQEIGVQAETLQQLGFAAAQSGSSLEGMTAALKILQRNAFAASKGGKEQAKGFSDLGVSLKDAHGKLRPADELLGDIADKIAAMPDGTAKTGAAMKVFGRSGASLIPLLNEGRDGIAALRKEFVDLGGQISNESVTALEAFGDEQDKIGVVMAGLRNQIVIGLLPTLRGLVEGFMEWYRSNREVIKQRIDTFVKIVGFAMRLFAKALGLVVKSFGWLLDHADAIIFVLTTIGVRMLLLRGYTLAVAAATTLWSRAAWAAGLQAAKAWVLASLPVLGMLAAIGLVILIIDDLYSWITGGKSVMKDAWGSIVKVLPEWWKHALGGMKLMLSDFADFVKDVFAGINEMFKDYNSQANRMALREEGKARGLTGKELDQFVENGVKNEITGNAAGVNEGPILGRAGETAFDRTTLGRLAYGATQQNVVAPAAMRFAPPAAQAAFAAAGGAMSFSPIINIQAPPGADEKKIADLAKAGFGEFFVEQMRRAKAGAGR